MTFSRFFPILISIAILVLIAFVQERSKFLAAIIATMPVMIPLSLWVVPLQPGELHPDHPVRPLVGLGHLSYSGFHPGGVGSIQTAPSVPGGDRGWLCGLGNSYFGLTHSFEGWLILQPL